eukprot:5486573-Prymnesium_polylepis.1
MSDVWALGVLLYQMVALRYPFEASTLPALALAIMHQPFAPLTEDTPPDVQVEHAAVSPCGEVSRPARHAQRERTGGCSRHTQGSVHWAARAHVRSGAHSPSTSLFTLAP